MFRTIRATLCTALTLAGCTTLGSGARGDGEVALATVRDSTGRVLGAVRFTEEGTVVRLVGVVSGLAPGRHGIHLHAVGDCSGTFAAAGGHFNPTGARHGLASPDGPHAGDLESLDVGSDGRATVALSTTRVTLGAGTTSLFDADGSALVIHAGPDDQRSDPAGNSGARVACGVVTRL